MAHARRRFAGTLALVLLAALAGCADPAADPRAGGPDPVGKGFCPPPEAPQAEPSPCITFDWNQRVAENHAYRSPLPITEEQRRQAAPKAEALAAALTRLAASGTSQDALRAAAARALSLTPSQIEVRGAHFDPPRDVLVGGGEGRVCVNGTVDGGGKAHAEVVGRTADGTCLPGLGGH
ncbi:precorrin-3B C(17)-methyltransferase [Actinacidiphila sp. bgisy160]|uniref:precorrin-3B C(17)-methyltransferase n=1 Tax=Actinacidiphila sp. bgisy160 TaxID=3413796 RepID=UPI003D73DBDF